MSTTPSGNKIWGPVALLFSGTILAQIITFLFSPVISRLFSPEEVGYQSLFIRIVSFLAVLATARYDAAYPLPKRNDHATHLLRFSNRLVGLSLVVITIVSLTLFFIGTQDEQLDLLILFIPLGVLAYVKNSQLNSWALRKEAYATISYSRLSTAILNGAIAIVLQLFGSIGLILGSVFSVLIGTFAFYPQVYRGTNTQEVQLNKAKEWNLARTYRDFPKANLPHVLIDLTKELVLSFCLMAFYGQAIVGLYDWSYRLLRIPVSLIGASIGQVLFRKVTARFQQQEKVVPLVRKTFVQLLVLSIVPFVLFLWYGEQLVAFVFGEEWRKAGVFAQIMLPWLWTNFLISPLSQLPLVFGKQKAFFWFGLSSFLLIVIACFIPLLVDQRFLNFTDWLWFISWSQTILLVVIIVWMFGILTKYDASLDQKS